jgi:hypothetical protein
MCTRLIVIHNISLWTCPHDKQPLLHTSPSASPILSPSVAYHRSNVSSESPSSSSWTLLRGGSFAVHSPSSTLNKSTAANATTWFSSTPSSSTSAVPSSSTSAVPSSSTSAVPSSSTSAAPSSSTSATPSSSIGWTTLYHASEPSPSPAVSDPVASPLESAETSNNNHATEVNYTNSSMDKTNQFCHCDYSSLYALHALWIVPLLIGIFLFSCRKWTKHKIDGVPALQYTIRRSRSWPDLTTTNRRIELPVRARSEPDVEVRADFYSVFV